MMPCSKYETNNEAFSRRKYKERAVGADSFSLRFSKEGGSGRTLMFLHTAETRLWLEFNAESGCTHI